MKMRALPCNDTECPFDNSKCLDFRKPQRLKMRQEHDGRRLVVRLLHRNRIYCDCGMVA